MNKKKQSHAHNSDYILFSMRFCFFLNFFAMWLCLFVRVTITIEFNFFFLNYG